MRWVLLLAVLSGCNECWDYAPGYDAFMRECASHTDLSVQLCRVHAAQVGLKKPRECR